MSAPVAAAQRFTASNPCPICGGHDRHPRDQGKRCFGFLSSDNRFVHCTREEHAGDLMIHPDAGTYAHRLDGACDCGTAHGAPGPQPQRNGDEQPRRYTAADFREAVAIYDYTDEAGAVLYRIARRGHGKAKWFAAYRPAPGGVWLDGIAGVRRVPYRLPELLAGIARGETVYVTEGEKKVDLLRALGLTATTNPFGAGKWRSEHTAALRAAQRVVIMADNDAPGLPHADAVSAALREAGIPDVLRIVPPVGEGKGIDDWLGETARGREDVELLAETAKPNAAETGASEPASEASMALDAEDRRPLIVVRNQLSRVVAETEAALLVDHSAGIYVRARMLVRVAFDRGIPREGLHRAVGSPVIEPLSHDALRKRLDRAASWVRWDRRLKKEVPALPPEWVARSILAADSWDFPPLVGVVESPTLRPDATLLDRPGYDAASGLLYLPDREFPRIPENPTSAQLVAAVRLLLEPLADFPFDAREDRAAAVSAIFSLVGRSAIRGPVPMHALRAPAPGTGKGLLADVIAIVATGRPAARTVLPPDDDSLRKAILAIALEGLPAILLDNIDRALGSSALAAALTAETWRDRLLGLSRTAEAPLRAVWLATGNGLTFRGDLGRRVIPIDLNANLEHPEDRAGFRHPDLLVWVRERRPELLAASLTVLRGYIAAGRPAHGCGPRKGSFEHWDDLVRGATVWAEFGDPVRGCERIRREDDSDLSSLRGALTAWSEAFGEDPTTAADATAAALRCADPKGANDPGLRDTLLTLTPSKDRLETRALGYALRRVRGRIVGGLRFERGGADRAGTTWTVKSLDDRPGGTAEMR